MKLIKQRLGIWVLLAILSLMVSVLLFIAPSLNQGIPARFLLAGSLMMSISSGGLGIWEYRRLKTARLITENQILSIYPAIIIEIQDTRENSTVSSVKPLEIIISCFGILLGSAVIKFNQNGIVLKAVEIEDDTIALTYGTKQQTRSIRLLHQSLDDIKLAEIVQAFRYETGVIPINKKINQ